MKHEQFDRKQELRHDLLELMDARQARLQRRRVMLVPVLGLALVMMAMVLMPRDSAVIKRVPVHVSWIPSVSLDHMIDSDRVDIIAPVTQVIPCHVEDRSVVLPPASRQIARLSASKQIERVDDEEVARLRSQVAKNSSS